MSDTKHRKSSIKVPLKYLLLAIALLAMACIGIAVMLKELHEAEVRLREIGSNEFLNTGYDLVIEFFKTVFIGACLGFAIDFYLKYLEIVESQKENLTKSGIKALFSSRHETTQEFIRLVESEHVRRITICGISLRDFLATEGSTHTVWLAIKHRLTQEEKDKLPPGQRLRVRLLLLDPRSGEGYFRYKIEEPQAFDNPVDIHRALREIKKALAIYKDQPQECFETKLYEHCPFSFLFLTETAAFVEQYYYRKNPDLEGTLPLIEYGQDTAQYEILSESLKIIWENANDAGIEIGTAIPIEETRIRNIYLANKRNQQGKHQVERIKKHSGETIDILNITAGFYVKDFDASTALREFAAEKNADGGTIRFALLNPVSQPAILRAIADEYRTEEMGEALRTYNWRTHQYSHLYAGIRETIKAINKWGKDHRVQLRLYSCSTTCALLLTSESAFVGHYIYGRSRKVQDENRLQSEYPMLEYSRAPADSGATDSQLEIMHSTFNIVWNHYSISYDDYKLGNREEAFNKNLQRLQEELCLPAA